MVIIVLLLVVVLMVPEITFADAPAPTEVVPGSGWVAVLGGIVTSILNGLLQLFLWAVNYVLNFLVQIIVAVLGVIAAIIPSQTVLNLAPVLSWLPVVNAWIPLDLGFGLYTTLILYRVAWLVIRYVWHAIPTMS